ncbi:hypothetical protein BDV26DRAFT_289794 [Aspergillus bertholletiae]|uniref:Uncharacterized protein n=1 Tax=Aspergillus bertholletiae TaxID=1226010 RepID=A0A5N7BH53_9EURO|nr:hypothetical protein BDV26DRAFT_289794 [Aspergillus bertholletiae]
MSQSRLSANCDDQNPAYMAETSLVTQLRITATEAKGDVEIPFPSDIVELLLRDETPLQTDNVNEILSALDKNAAGIIQSLDVVSLRILAYLLLNSGIQVGQERGLYLLLDESQPSVNNKSIGVLPTKHSRLTHQRLLNILYRIFIAVDQEHELRRLTGKLLAELMLELGEEGALILQAQEQDFAGVISIASLEADAVSKFFATVIIRAIHLTGISTKYLWTPDDLSYRRALFHTTDIPHDDIVKYYYLYVRKSRRNMFRDEGVCAGDMKETNGPAHPCYILRSIRIGEHVLAEGSIFTVLVSSTLIFLYAANIIDRKCFSYTEILLEPISWLMKSSASQSEGQESLHLHVDASISISINGKKQITKERTLTLQSNEDLTELRKALIKISDKGKTSVSTTRSKPQRSSMAVVHLDTAEVVLRKSKRLSEARARRETDIAKHTLRTNMSPVPSTNHPITTMASNTVGFDAPRGNKDHGRIGVIGGDDRLPSKFADKNEMDNLRVESPYQNKASKSNIAYSNSMASEKVYDQDSVTHMISRAQMSSEPRKIFANESAATEDQTRQMMSRREPSTLPYSSRNDFQLPNTQESLIFHSRRAYRKVYAANHKTAVDWDEDLRPSGESENSKESEFTPVSAPAPKERFACDKRPVITQQGAQEASSARKRRRTLAKSTGGAVKGGVYDVSVNKPTEVPGYKNEPTSLEDICFKNKDHGSSSGSEHIAPGIHANDDGDLIEVSAKGDTSCLEIEEHRQPSWTLSEPQGPCVKHIGRGQGIGGKLTVAFQLEATTTSQCKRSHSHGHDASPSPKSQSSSETTESSAQSIEEIGRAKQPDELNLPRDNNNVASRRSDTDRSMGLFLNRKRPEETQGTNPENCQGIVREIAMESAGIGIVGTELLNDRRCETEAGTDNSARSTHLTRSQYHNQPGHVDTPIIRPADSSSISTNEFVQSRSCRGSDEPGSGSERSGAVRTATSEYDYSGSAKFLRHDSQQVSEHAVKHQRMTPRKRMSIVDLNGSPRQLSHMESKLVFADDMMHYESQDRLYIQDGKQFPVRDIDESGSSGYDGGSEPSFVEISDAVNSLAPAVCGESRVHIENLCTQGSSLQRGGDDQTRRMHQDIFRAASIPYKQHSPIDHGAQGSYQSPSQGELVSLDSPQNTTVTPSTCGKSLKRITGETTLQALQRDTQSMLLESHERLTRELETEKQTVHDLLDTYRRQCHRVLDQFFEAQEERIALCKQQMDTIRHHHANVCQEIIHRVEAAERGARKRTNLHLGSEPRKRKMHKSVSS